MCARYRRSSPYAMRLRGNNSNGGQQIAGLLGYGAGQVRGNYTNFEGYSMLIDDWAEYMHAYVRCRCARAVIILSYLHLP